MDMRRPYRLLHILELCCNERPSDRSECVSSTEKVWATLWPSLGPKISQRRFRHLGQLQCQTRQVAYTCTVWLFRGATLKIFRGTKTHWFCLAAVTSLVEFFHILRLLYYTSAVPLHSLSLSLSVCVCCVVRTCMCISCRNQP